MDHIIYRDFIVYRRSFIYCSLGTGQSHSTKGGKMKGRCANLQYCVCIFCGCVCSVGTVTTGVVIVCTGVGSPRGDDPAQEVPTPDPDRRPPAAAALPHCVRTVPSLQAGPLAL